jgi:hypothetical protein
MHAQSRIEGVKRITIALLALTFAVPTLAVDKAALLDFARALPMRTKLNELKEKSVEAKLGPPGRTTYSWCNSAGCVDHEGEVGSTEMNVYWSDRASQTVLWVKLCHSWYAVPWQVIHVAVWQSTGKKDAWGKSKPPTHLLKESDPNGLTFCLAKN